MINNKRMHFIKSENKINYYLFKPSIFHLYYNDSNKKNADEPIHRYSIMHKIHMMFYILMGGYNVLYLEKGGRILSYIVFTKANDLIIKNCDKNDYYTIFLWTYPQYRGQGLATLMSKTMLNDLNLNYNHFYKTISKDNISSIRVAEKMHFSVKSDSVKKGIFHTINSVKNGTQYLYWLTNSDK